MEHDLHPQEDYSHTLGSDEYEALYFCFTAPDISLFGWMRLLFSVERVLEMVVLRVGDRTWVHQQYFDCVARVGGAARSVGRFLSLACTTPWQTWQLDYSAAEITPVEGGSPATIYAALTFHASNPPARYRFGRYQQSEQEGRLEGQLRIGERRWAGPLICYRDHSWGLRPVGTAVGWDALVHPERFYLAAVQTQTGLFSMGRVLTGAGEYRPAGRPILAQVDDVWRFEDAEAGLPPLTVRRPVAPVRVYLDPVGHETVRDVALPGDWLRDELGPAIFTDAEGTESLGFWERACPAVILTP